MEPPQGMEIEAWFQASLAWAEAQLALAWKASSRGPSALPEALRYPIDSGGKRLRPCLVRLVCLECGGSEDQAAAPAVAIEWLHTYSLVHDDLPCMDDDDLRRGRATTHRVFGEATGVLVGDGLLTMAFEHLATHGGPQASAMVAVLARAAGPAGMVGGQYLDLASEGQAVSLDGIREIHRLKTAALIAAACELGALAARAPAKVQQAAGRFGWALGLCFQAVDDCLDVTGEAAELGKTPGKDAATDKATLVRALGLHGARAEAEERAAEALEAAGQAGFDPNGPASALVAWLLARRF